MPLFKKTEIFQVKSTHVEPDEIPDPRTAAEYIKRGMAYYARQMYEKGESDLRKAASLAENSIDAYYGLGMVLKAQHHSDDSVKAFQKAIDLLAAEPPENKVRSEMLRRLALGHINEITIGDWNLEKEIWKHVD